MRTSARMSVRILGAPAAYLARGRKREAGTAFGIVPERDMPGIVHWIGAVLLRAGGSEDGDNRRSHCRCQVHWATIVADKQCAGFDVRGQLAETRSTRQIGNRSMRYLKPCEECMCQLLVVRAADQQYMGVALENKSAHDLPVTIEGPAFRGQFHTGIAAAARKNCDAQTIIERNCVALLGRRDEVHMWSIDGEADRAREI